MAEGHHDEHEFDPAHHQAPWVTVVTLLACFGFAALVLTVRLM
jgi:hypothetical protein